MWTLSYIWGSHREFCGQYSFDITVLPDLLDKMRTFYRMWEPHGEYPGPTSFENIILHDLIH